jgi:bifunctional DNA-binding transcriptional regulator/antitoxin component of YhaV-PrlF toxin-antitoxin module
MERLVVDQDGKVTIPSEVIRKRGVRPGDELALVESDEGLLIYHGGVDSKTMQWWNSLTEEERRQAREEARCYEAMSEQERDAIWNEGAESIEEEAEGDEVDLPAIQRSACEVVL